MTVEALRRGEPAILAELLERYGQEIQGVAYLILRDRSEAEDVLMDTLLSALDRASTLRDPNALRAWLLRIATNQALGRRRKAGRVLHLAILPERPVRDADASERLSLLAALDDLPARTRAAVVLHYYADLAVADVAVAMGTSPNTVKTQLRKALETMRLKLAEPVGVSTLAAPATQEATMAENVDPRLEASLREMLRTEAASLPLRVRANDVLAHKRGRDASSSRRRLRLLVLAAALTLPLGAALAIGLQPDDGGEAAYQAVIVRGLERGDRAGLVSDLEVVLASADGTAESVLRVPADRFEGFEGASAPKLSPSGRFLAVDVSRDDPPDGGHVVLDLQHPGKRPLIREGWGTVGWGPDDILWRAPNGPIERIDPMTGSVEMMDHPLPDDLAIWPLQGWAVPVAADGSGVVSVAMETYEHKSSAFTWSVVGSAGVGDRRMDIPSLAQATAPRLLSHELGALWVCDDTPESFDYCAKHPRGTVLSRGNTDGTLHAWRDAPVPDEFVLGASWASDDGVWVLTDRRPAAGHSLALVHIDAIGAETAGPSVALPLGDDVSIDALAPDDSLIALGWVTDAGWQTALLDTATGLSYLHEGAIAGFVRPATADTWPARKALARQPELLPSSPSPEMAGAGYLPLPPVEEQAMFEDGNLLIHEEPAADAAADGPTSVTLGPVQIEQGYGISLVCSGPGDVTYTVDDAEAPEDAYRVHCQTPSPNEWAAPGVKGGDRHRHGHARSRDDMASGHLRPAAATFTRLAAC